MNTLAIYRSEALVVTVNIDERTIFSQRLMGEHKVSAEFYSNTILSIQIGDYVTVGTVNFYINRIPSVVKQNNSSYKYNIDFESVLYNLGKKLFISIDDLSEYGRTGTAEDFIDDIVSNMNEIDAGWTKGTVASTDERTIVFSGENCWQALVKVAETFALEFSLTGRSISLVTSVGASTELVFEYGRDNGLYKIERQQIKDQNIVTKVFGFGSAANIPYTYRNRAKRLVFEERFLTKNTELYGIIEGQYINNDIFPNRTGTVTAVNNVFDSAVWNPSSSYVEDTALTGASGFDINLYFMDGLDPMIVFKSGDLSGQEFVIQSYDNVTGRIHYKAQSDEDGYTTPNPDNTANAGNLYTLVNISLPQVYIDQAEAALKVATQAFLDENSVPMVVYTVDIDPKWAKTNTLVVNAGDRVTVTDAPLGVDNLIRVSGIEFPLINPYAIKCFIADFVPYTLQERIIAKTVSNTTETRIVDRTADELTRRNAMRMRQLNDLIFDSDGYFDGTRIKPLSIETMYLSVGAKSQNFHLNGVTIQANYGGNPNSLYVSAGQLVHHEIDIGGNYVWEIGSAATWNGLDPNKAYYLYAKCSKSSLVGEWELSEEQLMADGEDGYYHFLCGILYSVYTDLIGSWRDFDFTYGMTYINGRTITTGRIQSLNHLNYFDLDTNTFRIGDNQHSLAWNVNSDGQLVLIGTLVQRNPGEYFPIMLFRGEWSPNTTYHKGDMVTYNSQSYVYINDSPIDGTVPGNTEFWELVSAIGEQGETGASPIGIYRGEYSPGTDYYGTSSRVDIVHWDQTDLYYIAKSRDTEMPFKGIPPDNTTFWSSFGANFESVATSLLFSEVAYIDNLGVRYFEGVPVGVGTLSGTPETVQANIVGTQRIDRIRLYGSAGSANITCSGVTRTCTFLGDLFDTAFNFFDTWYMDYYNAGVLLSVEDEMIYFTEINGEDFQGATSIETLGGSLNGYIATMTAHVDGQKRIDQILLTGSGGTADVTCDGITRRMEYYESLNQTALNFVAKWGSVYLATDVVLSVSGDYLIMTSRYKGTDFVGATSIVNVPSDWAGAVSIVGNEMWEDKTNNSAYGAILVNMKGYMGGSDYYRKFIVGNGKGKALLLVGHISSPDTDAISISCPFILLDSTMPRSSSGLTPWQVYADANGYLKIAPY